MSGPVLLRSSVLSVPHAFSTRAGGVSRGPFASLNLGNPNPVPGGHARDPVANMDENFRRITHAIGCEGREIVQVYQVHGGAAHVVHRGAPTHTGPGDTRADAIVTDDPGRVLCVRVADCAPVLIASGDGRVVAAVHAGWRGVIANVTTAAIAEMAKLGAQNLSAAVGPCISLENFEVGPEVAAEFLRVFGDDAPVRPSPRSDEKKHIDLKACLERQLRAAGVERVEVLPHCTVRDRELFYSHRRDEGLTGRMGAFIGTLDREGRQR